MNGEGSFHHAAGQTTAEETQLEADDLTVLKII